jgi:hypothetical protein
MNLDTELQYTLACFIGFMLESICYGKHRPTKAFGSDTDIKRCLVGIYCVIFAAFVRIRLKRKHDGSKPAILYLIAANFIACTAYLAVDVIASQAIVSLGVLIASNFLYICVDFISQVILVNFLTYDSVSTTDASGFPFSIKIYRYWIIWRQPWVMVVPILLTLAFLGDNLHNLNWNILKLMHF